MFLKRDCLLLPMQQKGTALTHFGTGKESIISTSLCLFFLVMAYLWRQTAKKRPTFNTRRKCAGIPIAAKITATVRPDVVLGTGAPKPRQTNFFLI